MATRRTVLQEARSFQKEDTSAPRKSDIAPAVPSSVIFKLLGFTFGMITLPIGSYFLTLNTIYGGNTTFAGATAAIVANIVLIGYVIVAMKEDQSDRLEAEEKARKTE
ncbi:hypothetical protein LTR04_001959 [Oleoguttula sp. CCFEE 6159]|nr:hypothetical protein LTR04_001959 [Oleoguttula sp. CCFEE 6159]TKA70978.1 hypothetical protein B0A49_06975 [Cryomyces minteri]